MTILSYPLKRGEALRLSVAEAEPPVRVRIVHAEVKGRARLKIEGLYRCEPVRLRIESALVRDAGIRQVSANVLTGRVLVVFDPTRTVEEITVLVEALLAAGPAAAEQNTAANITRCILRNLRSLLTPVRLLWKTTGCHGTHYLAARR